MKKRLCVAILSLLVLTPTASLAEGWVCSNRGLREISCGDKTCDFKDKFTPMEVRYNLVEHNGKKLEFGIGIYESYYEGKATSIQNGEYLIILGNDLINHPEVKGARLNPSTASAVLTISPTSGFGTLAWKGTGLYVPLICTVQ